ncbi:fimbrial protein, partial [Escherichia coli]
NAPCGIDPESADQSIDFGQTSKAHLESNGISVKKDLNIKLVNCNAAELSKSGSVKVSFSGTTIKGQVKELGTVGDTGTAIVISDASGGFIP